MLDEQPPSTRVLRSRHARTMADNGVLDEARHGPPASSSRNDQIRSSGAGVRPLSGVLGTSSSRSVRIAVLTHASDGIAGVADLLEGDEELRRVVRHPSELEQAVKEVGS
jgi:hypothetical protein